MMVTAQKRYSKVLVFCTSLKNIWKSHNICIATKVCLLKVLVWPVITYGCESWAIKKADELGTQAFEIK